MALHETLRLTLPRAADIGNLQVASRKYDLTIFTHAANAYRKLILHEARYTPVHIPIQIWVYQRGLEAGQFGGSGGIIRLGLESGTDDPMQLSIFNLSVDSKAQVTFLFEGFLFNDISWR